MSLEHFQNVIAVVTKSGASIAGHPGVENAIIAKGDIDCMDMTKEQLNKVKAGHGENYGTIHSQHGILVGM